MARVRVNKKVKLNQKPSTKDFGSLKKLPPMGFEEAYDKALSSVFEDLGKDAKHLQDYVALTAYSSVYTRVSDKLKEVIEAVDSIRYFYLVDVILNQIAEDALAPKMGSDEILEFSSQNETIQKELTELKKRLNLDQLVENIAPDILAYGEYTLQTKIGTPVKLKNELSPDEDAEFTSDNKGIMEVRDIVEQGTVISLSQDGKTTGYLVYDEQKGKIAVKEIADYIKFQMGGTRVKIESNKVLPHAYIKNPIVREIVERIPRFIRIGKSQLYSVIPKIKELELLEKLIPATKINKLSQGNLIGMNLPENYNLEEAMAVIKRMESMINKKISVDPQNGELTVEKILGTAGTTKLIPLFGDKGRLEQMDFRDNEPDDLLSSAKEIRELILDSVGVPSELVFKSEGESKGEVLKRYAKYLRKLKQLQKCIAQGVKQIAFIHLANKDIPFKQEEIEVKFNNNLVEIDNLDKLEHADVTLNLLSNIRDFFNEMAEEDSPYADMVNLDKVAEYLDDNLSTVGLNDAILTKKEGGQEADKEAVNIADPQEDDPDKGEPEDDKEE